MLTHSFAALCVVIAIITFVFEIDGLFTGAIIAMCLACLTAVVHIVVTAIGILRSGRRIFRPVIAIPFFREVDPVPERFVDAGGGEAL